MGLVGLCSAVLLLSLVALCSAAGSDAPRGVAVGFVFDPKAKCEPLCKHGGVCIRNNTCFCSKGYEGETCQYGDVTNFYFCFLPACICSLIRKVSVEYTIAYMFYIASYMFLL